MSHPEDKYEYRVFYEFDLGEEAEKGKQYGESVTYLTSPEHLDLTDEDTLNHLKSTILNHAGAVSIGIKDIAEREL